MGVFQGQVSPHMFSPLSNVIVRSDYFCSAKAFRKRYSSGVGGGHVLRGLRDFWKPRGPVLSPEKGGGQM